MIFENVFEFNLNIILDLVYPPVCGFCKEICKENLCSNCNKYIDTLVKNRKIDYRNNQEKYFNKHLYLFKYEEIIREKIIDYKFNEDIYLYKTFSRIILNNKEMCKEFKKYNMVIPIPIHKKRKQMRGYNQSELIIKELSKQLNFKFDSNLLYKKNNVIEQSKLNKSERIRNVRNVYAIKDKSKLEGKELLLFDDIYTTGATVNECSKILIKNGAKKVDVLTIAKD